MSLAGSRKLLVLYFLGMTCLHALLIWNAIGLIKKGYPDFTHMYAAGKIVRRGMGHQLYDDALQYRVQQEFASGVSIRHGALPYNHPPYEALLFVPLTYLPYTAAFILWDATSLLILLLLPFLLRDHIPLLQTSSPAFWFLATVAFYPVSVALLQGQDIILLLLLISLSFASFKTGREFAAGAWLALGLFRFHLLVPFFVMMLVQKRRRALYGFVSVGAVLVALSIAMLGGWSGAMTYPEYAWNAERNMGRGAIVPADMPNLRGLLDTSISPLLSKHQVDFVYLGVGLALLAIAAWKWHGALRHDVDLSFSIAVILSVLASYHAFAYDLTLYLVPIALLVNYYHRLHRRLPVGLLVPMAIFYCSPILMILWLHYGQLNLLAPVMLIWFWAAVKVATAMLSPDSHPSSQLTTS